MMKKKLALVLAMAMVFTMALAGCGGDTSTEEPAGSSGGASTSQGADASSSSGGETESSIVTGGRDGGGSVTFATGGTSGTYYGFGGVLATTIGSATSTTVNYISSNGSQDNIYMMMDGDANMGFVQSDVMAYAYDGSRLFEADGAIDTFSTVAALYMEQVQIVTLDPEITSVADLEGKNVSVGAANSGVYFNALDILGAYGLEESDINSTYQNFADSTDALINGTIDAAFIVAGAPTAAVQELATGRDVYLVGLDQEHIDALIETSPYYSPYTITADTYGTPGDVQTVAVGAVVIANDDVPEDDIYNFLYGIFENIPAITAAHGKGAELDMEFATSVIDVPYHAGAVAYFAEKGIEVPGK